MVGGAEPPEGGGAPGGGEAGLARPASTMDGTREEDADGPPEPPPASWFDETPDSGEETQ
ncbi:MAG: hypothetical protein ACLVL7_14695 [Anaerotruncus massiliensis (ex Togo et al. 2019)]